MTAPWAVQAFKSLHWKKMLLGLFFYYFTVDGGYWLYWYAVKPEALVMREANFYASSCLYWLCGFIWLHNGSLKELLANPVIVTAQMARSVKSK